MKVYIVKSNFDAGDGTHLVGQHYKGKFAEELLAAGLLEAKEEADAPAPAPKPAANQPGGENYASKKKA